MELFKYILLSDFLRYFITAGSGYVLFWILLKRRWEHRNIQKKQFKRSRIWFEFRHSMYTIVIFALIGWALVTAKNAGYTQMYDEVAECGLLWLMTSIVLMIVLHDTWFYWTHRFMHLPVVFKHVHLVHHRSTNPSPWAAYSFHPIEAVIEAGIFPLIVFSIPAHGFALMTFLIYMIIRNVQGHLGIEILPRWFISNRWLNWHTTTTHHDLHHRDFNGNFGLYFTFWDRWCGTENKSYRSKYIKVTSRKGNADH